MTARLLDAVAVAVSFIAGWSIAGAIAGLVFDDPATSWLFVYSLVVAALTLIAIGIFEGRLDG